MSTSLVQMRIDTELRDDANKLFDSLGLDMSTAVKDRSAEGLAAFLALRKQAEDNGLTGMSLDEINEEIAAVRAEKGKRST